MLLFWTCSPALAFHVLLRLFATLLPSVASKARGAGLMRTEIMPHGQVVDKDTEGASTMPDRVASRHSDQESIATSSFADPVLFQRSLAIVASRMRYWSNTTGGGMVPGQASNNSKFLLFDFDEGGLNNLRLGWEVAGIIALVTNRTLVLPPASAMYLIDCGPPYFHPPMVGSKSNMEDFINMAQLKSGIPALSFSEFRATHGEDLGIAQDLSDQEVMNTWEGLSEAKTISPADNELCELKTYHVQQKVLYVQRTGENGRLFGCSMWWDLGQMHFTLEGHDWPLPARASSVLQNNFVWHPEVFELAAPVINELGLFEYNSLHARYGDLQFQESRQSAESIAETWFLSELGQKIFGNKTLYISTDDMSDSLIQKFRERGIDAKWSKDYFENPSSPIASLIEKKGAVRINQLKGPVEQIVCAFGQIFLGTKKSTFSAYINQLRMMVGAPQHGPHQEHLLYHTNALSLQTVHAVSQQLSNWRAHGDQFTAIIEERSDETTQPSISMDILPWATLLVFPLLLRIAISGASTTLSVYMCYVATSVSFIIFNKEAAINFPTTYLLIATQMCVASLAAIGMDCQWMISCNRQSLARWIIVSIMSTGAQIASIRACTEATVITIVIIKDVLPVASLLAESCLLSSPRKAPVPTMLSLLCILLGSLVYGRRDLSITLFGQFLVALHCTFTIIDRLCQSHLLRRVADFNIPLPGCMLLNNSISMLPIIFLAARAGEMHSWRFVLARSPFIAWFWIVVSSLCGACLSYVSFRAQSLASGTSMLVLTNMSKLLVLMSGSQVFGERFRVLSTLGLIVSLVGFCWYGCVQLRTEAEEALCVKTG